MSASSKSQMIFLPLADIQIGDRLRGASEPAVASIDASIRELGLLSPLHVQKRKEGYFLLDGLHRFRASERVGLEEVPVIVHRVGQKHGLKIEVASALASSPLDPLSAAVFLARHKDLYEEEHPEAKAAKGAELVRKRWDTSVQNTVVSFAENAAEVFGWSTSKIFKLIKVGQSLSSDDVAMLRAAPNKIKTGDLQALSKIEPDMRSIVCRELSLGKIKSVKEVLDRRKKPGAKKVDPAEAQLSALNDKFIRASKAVRLRFIRAQFSVLSELIAEVGTENDDNARVVAFKARERG